ncbi:MAG: S-layer homology domain-containing protein [Clostridiales bacterium]|nr:S-layer homology domain-containing protein [Clostridiales bacterium]
MRNLKKFLALVLAMMMAFSLMVTVNAANEADNGSNQYNDKQTISAEFEEAVDVLYGMGVMTGDYGAFKGDQPVMRSEMAAILYRVMTGDTNQLKNVLYADIAASRFYDVTADSWFAPYIGWCYDAGIMVGSNGYFRPTANVTGYETLVMVLRAMGYGKNGEYTGLGWNVNASASGTQVGLLKDVNNSSYSNTLAQNTRRDVVASIVFQGLQLPTVTWTPSLGYNKYDGVAVANSTNRLNPSLGETYFGLTCAYGVVVGNQATGESVTKIGFTRAPGKGTVNYGEQYLVGPAAYSYGSYAEYDADLAIWGGAANGAPDVKTASNVTGNFAWSTDLSLFNHAVKVWFDWNSTKTYALYDEATATAIVTTPQATDTNITPALLAGLADGNADPDNNWDTTTLYNGGVAFFNYSFAAMTLENRAANAGATYTTAVSGSARNGNAISAVSPIKETNDSTGSSQGLYLLISNNSSKTIDVVISLDLTMSEVVQANTTTAPLSVGVLANNQVATTKGGNIYFGVSNDYGKLAASGATGADTNYVSLLQKNLLNTTEAAQKMGTKVAAIEITGTNTGVPATPGTAGDASNAGTNFDSTFYYQLTQPQYFKTAKVIKIDTANNDVYLEDGSKLHQSVFAEATDEGFIKNDVTGSTSGMEGYSNTSPVGMRLIAGREYTFTLDAKDGNYIYWTTPSVSSNFVYGTYIDWETKTASSLFDYPMVHVTADGKQRQVANIGKVDGDVMDIDEYDDILLPKRDKGNGGNNSGFVKGIYIGYALSADGTLTSVTNTNSQGTGFLQGDATYFGAAITVNNVSVVLGAQEVAAASNMFLTENTQFYIVDGAGTVNQTVTPYKGVSALMEGMSSVVIHGEAGYLTAANEGSYLDNTKLTAAPYEMFYYEAGRFDYDQNYDASALEIKTIFLPAPCVEFNKSTTTSLVFVGDASATMINSNNGNFATQVTVYDAKGTESSVWIDGDYTITGNDAYTVSNASGNGDNVFYELKDSGKEASDGKPIYNIRAVQNPDTTVIGQYWDGTTVQVTNNVGTGHGSAYTTGTYQATTFNQQAAYIDAGLFNVGSAGIKNLNTSAYPGIVDNNLTTLNGAGSLATNNGVSVSCVLNADSTLTVDFIFVNA